VTENFLWAAFGCLAGAVAVILWIMWHLRRLWK
jgi:hypothetical protein